MKTLSKYSMGIGDRFGKQGSAQLAAIKKALDQGVGITPIWNKSYREHKIIHTDPSTVRVEADTAVAEQGWKGDYYVDADHINRDSVDLFIPHSDFFTLDVADFTGRKAEETDISKFVAAWKHLCGNLSIKGIDEPITITESTIRDAAENYLLAVQEAGHLYRYIEKEKGAGNFVTEVSMDETDKPQSPAELLFILAAISGEGIPAQTIAPKFTGRFNKGVDYVGDLVKFEQEFKDDICVIAYAVENFNLPGNLKLSIHSGSDKFSIFPIMKRLIQQYNTGLHLKTAGTTWLEEIIGLAESGTEAGVRMARKVYRDALSRYEELTAPYAAVIDINLDNVPTAEEFETWPGSLIAHTVRHNLDNRDYNLNIRQLLHVGYKVASDMGDEYLKALENHAESIGKNVTENIWERHIKKLFV